MQLGFFDSGLGGLTVLRAFVEAFPHLSTVYVGDTARVPYGGRSPETITEFSLQLTKFLEKQGVAAIIVACNSASAVSLSAIKKARTVPVYGVIAPAAHLAAQKGMRIGVIGTRATIASKAYERAIHRLRPTATIYPQPCPLFVPLVEEGLLNHPAARLIATEYLAPLKSHHLDALILGCTHYPLLAPLIASIIGKNTALISSSHAIVKELREDTEFRRIIVQTAKTKPTHTMFVTDNPQRFTELTRRFFGVPTGHAGARISFVRHLALDKL